MSAEPAVTQAGFDWIHILSDGVIVHRDSQVLALNSSAERFRNDPQLIDYLNHPSNQWCDTVVDDEGLPWSLQSRWMVEYQCWLTQIRPAMDENFAQVILANPKPILIHDHFKPLFVNQAYIDMFQLKSIRQFLTMDSIRPMIGEEHWPYALRNYQILLDGGCLESDPISSSWTADGKKFHTRVQDFVIEWQGRRVVCTTIHDMGFEQDRLERYRQMAFTDPLTNMANRRRFKEQGASHLIACLNNQLMPSLAVVDIDHFKQINDKFGHPVGDQVLQHLAALLTDSVDQHGLAARIGGEEFALFSPQLNKENGKEWVRSIKERIDAAPFILGDGTSIPIKVSIGLTYWCGGIDHLGGMYERADEALYLAKRSGRDQIRVV